jgi:CheY-like chemotaxis protein
LVEDNDDARELIRLAFEQNNFNQQYELIIASTGIEALNYLFPTNISLTDGEEHLPPSLAILDLNLQEINGLEVLQRIRSDRETKYLPVVIMSASGEPQDIINSYRLGCNSYVLKPLNFNELQSIVRNIVLYWLTVNAVPPTSGVLDV